MDKGSSCSTGQDLFQVALCLNLKSALELEIFVDPESRAVFACPAKAVIMLSLHILIESWL